MGTLVYTLISDLLEVVERSMEAVNSDLLTRDGGEEAVNSDLLTGDGGEEAVICAGLYTKRPAVSSSSLSPPWSPVRVIPWSPNTNNTVSSFIS